MLGEFEYLLLSASARLGTRGLRRGDPRWKSSESSRRALFGRGALHDPGPPRGQGTDSDHGWATRHLNEVAARSDWCDVTAKGEREAAAFYRAVMTASRGVSWAAETEGRDMTGIRWAVVHALLHGLTPDERDAVLGDMLELQTPVGRALRDAVGPPRQASGRSSS